MISLQSVIDRDDATTLSLLIPETYSPDSCLEKRADSSSVRGGKRGRELRPAVVVQGG